MATSAVPLHRTAHAAAQQAARAVDDREVQAALKHGVVSAGHTEDTVVHTHDTGTKRVAVVATTEDDPPRLITMFHKDE